MSVIRFEWGINNMSKFDNLLRENGLTKAQFAKIIGYSPNQVTRWGENPPGWVILLLDYRAEAYEYAHLKGMIRRISYGAN